ncbi:MAG TPA: hypothetical protein VFX73_09950, partial [Chitinophagaceae bacterium]|nr:hypothetical protein [Chitinophagaceae bacterium]
RYVIGDELFLSTLKKLATDPRYTYDNFVTTSDVEKLFSSESKQDLKPFFDFYTRTTDMIDISIRETGYQKYAVKLNNYFMPLPFDITTSAGTSKMVIGKDGITVSSTMPPQVDARGNYYKKITLQ